MCSATNPNKFEDQVISEIQSMVDEYNVLAKNFRMANDRFCSSTCRNVRLKLIGRRDSDGRTYNLPTASEVVALIVGDVDTGDKRDIVVETQNDSYKVDVMHRDKFPSDTASKKRDRLTMREFFAYRIQDRRIEFSTILLSRRLYQQFLVDGCTKMEAERLSFIRNNQQALRADNVKNLKNAIDRGDTDGISTGNRVILPASVTGGHSYMRENYQDAMAICRWYGYPDLFITFTCNPKWPEITRFVKKKGLRPEDRPDIVCCVFKIKLDKLVNDLKERKIFGRVRAVVYTIEFQKRGLPHAHILLFLHRDDKLPNTEDIDKIICAELPDKEENPELYEIVTKLMIHGPCGNANTGAPCMVDKKCSKHFPKKFNEMTKIDEEGYPFIEEEILEQRVTAAAYHNQQNPDDPEKIDEIKMYYDCQYISPCEVVWRIFGFNIHYRTPPVERLSFHLPDEQMVMFSDDSHVESVLERPNIERTKFLSWMECNKTYDELEN
ncbi:uncharacterized protein LOC125497826 [Beta vulgaris subsp. vulgaris]|uniref:uncharacterized protein LOC125497826 n=1 Tax=Beta vulgaris subsp. vulgaris TaxID=3555 RepID=UPI0025475300|nr:uncharacterized protein LOC125497826 [Beta vulgaris subsp. vulgaris]